VDEKGHVQYGDKPPPGVNAIPIEPTSAPRTLSPPEDLAAKEAAFRQRQIKQREEEEKLAREEKLRQERCDQAKNRLALAERTRRPSRTEKGERVELNDAERATQLDTLKTAVAKHCR
jgi:hypothetical protein